ncbi:hypothetical protein AX14_012267 [Amanita brunnescens Koide BX004]|nr:hypothetical protein AX14_012267 [Amanita brunnescens Koide BX004]
MVQLTVVTFTVLIQLALMTQSSVGLPIQSADMLQLRSLNNQNEPFIQQLSKRVGNPLKCFSRLVTFCKGRRKKSGQVYEDGLIPVASEFEDSLHHPVEPAQTPPQLHRPQTGPHELPTGNQHDRPHELENTGRGSNAGSNHPVVQGPVSPTQHSGPDLAVDVGPQNPFPDEHQLHHTVFQLPG